MSIYILRFYTFETLKWDKIYIYHFYLLIYINHEYYEFLILVLNIYILNIYFYNSSFVYIFNKKLI